ncbi:hypothetical protein E2C01_094306 [Portunus trituberculatus]|uniref:Uncharacterized protein n=1 Tax=Portunus trituberculatus TaxID=210409 RepID=A0A5B7JVT0_PORTR|nr:hypothetical protein [Portunus trituberculatus]
MKLDSNLCNYRENPKVFYAPAVVRDSFCYSSMLQGVGEGEGEGEGEEGREGVKAGKLYMKKRPGVKYINVSVSLPVGLSDFRCAVETRR